MLYEFDYWIENRRQIEVYGKEIPPEVSPFCKIEAIVAVYFPQFIERIAALDKAARDYRKWMGKGLLRGLQTPTAQTPPSFQR